MKPQSKMIYAPLITGILVLIASLAYTNYRLQNLPLVGSATEREERTLYDTVMDRGEIRVGYYNGLPYFLKDPNTGEVSGIFADILDEIGTNLGLDIVWEGESNFPTMSEDLESGKYDIIGSGIWINSDRGKVSDFSMPILFDVVGAYVRVDDDRFDDDLSKINDSNVVISTIDGEMAATIAKEDYPNADSDTASLPESTDFSQMLFNVEDGKADVTFLGLAAANEYIYRNPNSIRLVSNQPIRIFPTAIMIKRDEYEFTRMINMAISDLFNSGFIDRTIDKYEQFPQSHYRLANPYQTGPN